MISYKRLVFNILLLAFSVVMCIGTKMLYPLIFLFLWKSIK